jgi:hypothetical protein
MRIIKPSKHLVYFNPQLRWRTPRCLHSAGPIGRPISFLPADRSKKLCNKFQLTESCSNLASNSCSFNHSPINEAIRNLLCRIAASTVCARMSTYKNLLCLNGHACQKPDCKNRGVKCSVRSQVPCTMSRCSLTYGF